MPISMFVKKDDRVVIEVFVFEKDGTVQAVSDKKEIPKTVEHEAIEFYFRKASFSDSTALMRGIKDGENIDFGQLQETVMGMMLAEWNLTDAEGKKVPLNKTNIDSLLPVIGRAAATAYLSQIQI